MIGKYWTVLFAHLLGWAFLKTILEFILPVSITSYFTCIGSLILFVILAKYSFALTKKKWLSDTVEPEDRAVIITGCDSGFGNGLAKRLDSKGFRVFASCLNDSSPGAQELKKTCSKRLMVLPMDVTKDESVKNALQVVKDNLGTSDLWALVNNAGVFRGTSVELTSMEDYKLCMEVNAFGTVRVTRAFLPLLRQIKGRVVNLTSIAGRLPAPYLTAYCMSKFTAVAFNGCLRQEMADWGVKVISIEPEFFKTPMTDIETSLANMNSSLNSIDEDVKRDYNNMMKYIISITSLFMGPLAIKKLDKVLDALVSAVSLEYPDLVYFPSRHFLVQILAHLYLSLPYRFQDKIAKIILYVLGFF